MGEFGWFWQRVVDESIELRDTSAPWIAPLAMRRLRIIESITLMQKVDGKLINLLFSDEEARRVRYLRERMTDPDVRERTNSYLRLRLNGRR